MELLYLMQYHMTSDCRVIIPRIQEMLLLQQVPDPNMAREGLLIWRERLYTREWLYTMELLSRKLT